MGNRRTLGKRPLCLFIDGNRRADHRTTYSAALDREAHRRSNTPGYHLADPEPPDQSGAPRVECPSDWYAPLGRWPRPPLRRGRPEGHPLCERTSSPPASFSSPSWPSWPPMRPAVKTRRAAAGRRTERRAALRSGPPASCRLQPHPESAGGARLRLGEAVGRGGESVAGSARPARGRFPAGDAARPRRRGNHQRPSASEPRSTACWPAYRDPDTKPTRRWSASAPARHSPPLRDNRPPSARSCDASHTPERGPTRQSFSERITLTAGISILLPLTSIARCARPTRSLIRKHCFRPPWRFGVRGTVIAPNRSGSADQRRARRHQLRRPHDSSGRPGKIAGPRPPVPPARCQSRP